MKSNSSVKNLTKYNILFWSLSFALQLLAGFLVTAFFLAVIVSILGSNLSIIGSVCIGLASAAAASLMALPIIFLQRLPGLQRLNAEENFLNIRINETLGKTAIPETDRIYVSDQWLVMTARGYKGYVFHKNYIIDMERFRCSRSQYENGYRGRLLTADGKAWKVFFGMNEYEAFIKWFQKRADSIHADSFSNSEKGSLMEHDINLNIHYSAPKEVWSKIENVYKSMPYWAGDDIDLWASVEPGGIQIAGTMPEDIWNEWYNRLKIRLSEALGYEIGEPEEGYDFKYWE